MIVKAWRWSKFLTFCAVFIAPAALGCLWVLAGKWTGVHPGGGVLWWLSIAAAPWVLLGAALFLLGSAAVRFFLHRAARETRRLKGALGIDVPTPGLVREHVLVGAGALALSALILAPRYLPAGVLISESEEVGQLPVPGSQRWENGKYVHDYAQQRVLHCTYLTFHGLRYYNGPAFRQMPYCSYFYEE